MELSDLQNKVVDFVENNELETNIEVRLIDLISEIGELSKENLKISNYGKEEFKKTEEWESEFGDVLFSLICIANNTDIDLEKSLNKALDKYKKRNKLKGDISSGK